MDRIAKLENIKKDFELLLQERFDKETASVLSTIEYLISIEKTRNLKARSGTKWQ